MTCNYRLTPGFFSPRFTVLTNAQAICSTGTTSNSRVALLDGQGASDSGSSSASADVAPQADAGSNAMMAAGADISIPASDAAAGSDASALPTNAIAAQIDQLVGGRKLKM